MLERVIRLREDVESTRTAIERLLEEHGLYMDSDMAGVIQSYVKALQLDFELALTRGQSEDLARILEDMRELHLDTRARLLAERAQQGFAAAPIQG